MSNIDPNANANANGNNGEGEANIDLGNEGEGEGSNDNGAGEGEGAPDKGKNQETDEARLSRLHRQTNQARKKAGLDPIDFDAKPTPRKEGKKKTESGELDYGQKAYAFQNGVKTPEEIARVQEIMAETGKNLEQVLASKYVQAELAEMRDHAATESAVPTGKNRSNNPGSTNTPEYWIKKGTMPANTPENQQLRRDIVNAKIKAEKTVNVFSANPVIGQ